MNSQSKLIFTALIDNQSFTFDKQPNSAENTLPTTYTNVKAYLSYPWYPAVDGNIRNLEIQSNGPDINTI